MTPEQWALVERLYHEGAGIALADRESWLARGCGGDERVRQEVASLLAQDASVLGVLDGHALDQITPEIEGESLVGRQLGGYEFLSLIDEGGMGQVYRARDLTLPRDVAVKVVSPQFTHDAARRARFRQEAEVLAAFAHPHIAHIYAFSEVDGRFLLAMELVPGETLAARISRGPLRISEALDIAAQVTDALDAAHQQGVIHRDLKPANIRITPDGVVKVLDFGLATTASPAAAAVGGSFTRTAPGTLLGTVAYMSPEQARGDAVDKRTDIWAFGCVLFEMLTGVRLFASTSAGETLALVITQEVEWSRLPAHTPAVVRALLRRCIERDQRKRLGDVAAIRFALDDVARIELTDAGASGVGDGVAEGPARHQPAHPLAGRFKKGQPVVAITAVLLAVAGAIWVATPAQEDSLLPLPQGIPMTTTGDAMAPAISSDGNQVAYVQRSDEGDSLLLRQTQTILTSDILTLVSPGARILATMFTPDGQFVDYVTEDSPRDNLVTEDSPRHNLRRVPSIGGKSVLLIKGVDSATAHSPDRRFYAFLRLNEPKVDQTSLLLADADSHKVVRLVSRQTVSPDDIGRKFVTFQLAGHGPPRLAWSADAATIAVPARRYPDREGLVMYVTVGDGSVKEMPVNEGGQGGAFLDAATLLWSMAAGPDQPRQLFSLSHPSGPRFQLTNDLSDYGAVSVSERRDALVAAQVDPEGEIWIRDRSGDERTLNTSAAPPRAGPGPPLAWVGHSLLYSARSRDRRGIWVADAVNTGRDAEELVPDARFPSANANGSVIIFISPAKDSPNTLWQASGNGENRRQVTSDVLWPVIHPTDRYAVFVRPSADGLATLWRVALDGGRPEEIAHLAARAPDISPDGLWLAFANNQTTAEVIGYCELRNCSTTSVRFLSPPGLSAQGSIRWTPDSSGIAYVNDGGTQNIWVQPLKGGEAKRLTRFTDGRTIKGFAWSPDARLAVLRERTRSDIVLYKRNKSANVGQ